MGRVFLKSKWSKEQTIALLQELRNHPVLYNQTHPQYQQHLLRIPALKEMVEKLKDIKPDVTPEHISQKIKGMKSQFCMEKVKMETMSPEKRSSYVPTLWCYDMLTFFENSETSLRTKAIIRAARLKKSKEENDLIEHEEDPISTPEEIRFIDTTSETNGATHNVLITKCLELIETLTNEMKTDKEEDEAVISSPQTFLALLIENELSNISEEVYNDAKWKIMHVLEEAFKKDRELKAACTLLHSTMTQTSIPYTQTSVSLSGPIFKNPAVPLSHGSRVVILNTNMENNHC